MKKTRPSRCGFFRPRVLLGFVFGSVGVLLALLGLEISSGASALAQDSKRNEGRGDSSQMLVASPAAGVEIAPEVLADTADGRNASVVILLAEQADVSAAYAMKDQDARGWFVYNTLTQHAASTQAGLQAFLTARGASYQSFWAANMIVATVNRSLVESLAARTDVGRIDSNRPARWIEDPEVANFEVTPSNPNVPNTVEWGVSNVNAPTVWALGFTGQGIVVGDLDTGMRWTHNALKPRYRGWNGVSADHNFNWHDAIHSGGGSCGADTQAPCDDTGHGTHTAGTAVGDDGAGNQVGVAPGAKWIGCRNMDQGNGTPATYTECFQFMIAPTDLAGNNANPVLRPHVVNNSWGCPAAQGCVTRAELETIVNNTQAAGIFVAVSAGSFGPGCSSVTDAPAIYSASFSTGAINISNVLASFSSRGPSTFYTPNLLKPNVSAPGVNVRSTYSTSDSNYAILSGTSMAAPHVVGVVALLWSARPELVRDIAATKSILQNSANPAVTVSAQTCGGTPSTQIPNNSFGYGRVDALAAVDPTATATPTPTSTATATATASATATATPAPTATPTPTCPNPATVFSENFDAATPPTLPAGWAATNAVDPDAIVWVTSNSGVPMPVADSAPNAAFINDPATVSDKRLDSPSIAISSPGAQLTFKNNYNLESTFDGGVLEISIGGGVFTDIIAAGGTFVTGGYNATISTSFSSPIAGRMAWSGNSGGFITTVVNLPAAAAGQNINLRWRMGSDSGVALEGWRIDGVVVVDCLPTPTPTPTLTPGTPTPTPCSSPATVFGESFDGVTPPTLPAGWVATNAVDPDAILWVTSSSGVPIPVADSAPNAAFINDPATVSDKRLDSSVIPISNPFAQLTFRNNYNLENTFDGGVLEISIGGGAFTDIVTAGGSFATGGYTATISTSFSSPIAGRMAWSGNSGGFITTAVNLPVAAAGQNIKLRWRMASDTSVAIQGWRIDSVVILDCPTPLTVSLPTATFDTSVPVATVIIQPVITTFIDPSLNYVGFQGDFTFDSAVVTFSSPPVQRAGLTATNWNLSGSILNSGPGTIKTFRLSAFSNDFTPLSGSGTLFNLRMLRVSSTPGATSPLVWKAAPDNFIFIDDNLDTHTPGRTPPGSITIIIPPPPTPTPTPTPTATPSPTPAPTQTPTPTPPPTVNISGTVSYCSNPVPGPVPNVTLTLTGSVSGSTLSDGSGSYQFLSLATGGSYTVTPTKSAVTPGSSSINTVDVIAVQRHFLQIAPLSGCRLKSADVNGDNIVNTVDGLAIRQFFFGHPTANVGKYQFTPANRSYPGLVSNQTGQNYDVLIFGDAASPFADRPGSPSQDTAGDDSSAGETPGR